MKKVLLLICLTLLCAFGPGKQLTWVAIGDSITYHNGKSRLSSVPPGRTEI